MTMTIAFFGHSDAPRTEELRCQLKAVVEQLAVRGATEFLLGGYGAFDEMAAGVVRELKGRQKNLCAVLVLPYLERKLDVSSFDSTIYPPLETVPKKFAISHRNRWMAENADVIVAYVNHGWGGAAAALRYAIAKKKEIIQLGSLQLPD